MSYIIVWRHRHRDPHLDLTINNFLETYASFEDAKKEAETIQKQENEGAEKSPWYFDYAIYEQVNS